jgi:hypothetical protein
MDLKKILLEQITDTEFKRLRSFWFKKTRPSEDFDFARIIKPLTAENYDVLLEEFVVNAYSDKVSVNKVGKWIRYYTRNITPANIQEIAEIASADRFKKGHLELYFKVAAFEEEHLRICFAEINSLIVGYHIQARRQHYNLFSWTKQPQLQKKSFYAIWIPSQP